MIILKDYTNQNGLLTRVHVIQQFNFDVVENVTLFTDSWVNEADFKAGNRPAAQNAIKYQPSQLFRAAVLTELTSNGPLANGLDYSAEDTSIDTLKVRKIAQLKESRDALIKGGFIFGANTYDSDDVSQSRILGAYVAGDPYIWRTATNEWISLTEADIGGLWTALQLHTSQAFTKFAEKEAMVLSATTVEEINSITF